MKRTAFWTVVVLLTSSVANAGPSTFDGTWEGSYSCGPLLVTGGRVPDGFTTKTRMVVWEGRATWSESGKRVNHSAQGTALGDGHLGLSGGCSGLLRDVDGALRYFEEGAAERYRPALVRELASLPAVADKLGNIVDGSIFAGIAEYLVSVTAPGQEPEAYLIYLMQGADGVWRITDL